MGLSCRGFQRSVGSQLRRGGPLFQLALEQSSFAELVCIVDQDDNGVTRIHPALVRAVLQKSIQTVVLNINEKEKPEDFETIMKPDDQDFWKKIEAVQSVKRRFNDPENQIFEISVDDNSSNLRFDEEQILRNIVSYFSSRVVYFHSVANLKLFVHRMYKCSVQLQVQSVHHLPNLTEPNRTSAAQLDYNNKIHQSLIRLVNQP